MRGPRCGCLRCRTGCRGRDSRSRTVASERGRPRRRSSAALCRCWAKTGPFGCVGQPTWVQRLDMMVKLGTLPTDPLLRTYAARRETSPACGSARNVATTNSPSGNAEIGPRSTGRCRCRENDGNSANPAAGSATPRATRPPSASVARSRAGCACSAHRAQVSGATAGTAARAAATRPANARRHGDRGAERRDHERVDDEADEQDRDADREGDRRDSRFCVLDLGHLRALLFDCVTRAHTAPAGRAPASRFRERCRNAWSSSLPSRVSRRAFAGEATVASSGVVENAVPDASRTGTGYATRQLQTVQRTKAYDRRRFALGLREPSPSFTKQQASCRASPRISERTPGPTSRASCRGA